ncbi:hypothetical protein T03_8447 [Trichinella britovi]|uniref:Uncharacterized protein n=1 Tax=Trichinella britovi TaxID=45882 RepID=A0A0V1CL17_TRIBR|nr:hypothetical protein T03_8447 [Trichinella britovi]
MAEFTTQSLKKNLLRPVEFHLNAYSITNLIDDMSDVVRFDIQMRLKYNFQCQLSHSLSELNIEKRLRLLSIAVMRKVKLVCLLIILIGSIVSSTLYPHLCNSYCEEIPLRTTPSRTTQHNREMRFPGDPNYANFYSAYLKRERKFQCTKTGFERCAMQITIAIKIDDMSDVVRFDIQMRLKYNFQCQLSHSLSELNIEKWLRLLSIAVMGKVKLVCLLIILIGSIVSSTLYLHLCNSYCEEIPLRTTPSRTTQHNREMRFPGDPNYANFYSAYLKRERFVLISERYRLNVNNEEKKGKRCRREAKCVWHEAEQ